MTEPSDRLIPHLVTAHELAHWMSDPDVRVVDVRWRLGDPSAGPTAFARGHIPGAVFADIDRDLAGPRDDANRGRHPLPSPEAFEALAARLGIGDATRVIAYDNQGGATAARLWFLLRYFGHETGAVLDGGLRAFVELGRALESEASSPTVIGAPFRAAAVPGLVVDRHAVTAHLRDEGTLLIDARAGERYRGEVEPIDPRAGHIPSAVNLPYASNLADGRFLPREALAARYAAVGAWDKKTTVYCGSGVTACHDLLALAIAGHTTAALYAGSWSDWASDAAAPVAVGDGS